MSERRAAKDTDPRKWFSGGLRFECTGCGACCTGEPGIVRITEEERGKAASFLEIPVKEFAGRYLRDSEGSTSLKEKANGDCIFFQRPSRLCRIYPVRPAQCRTYPFWPEILASKKRWKEEASFCPGIGRGKLHGFRVCLEKAEEAGASERDCRRAASRSG